MAGDELNDSQAILMRFAASVPKHATDLITVMRERLEASEAETAKWRKFCENGGELQRLIARESEADQLAARLAAAEARYEQTKRVVEHKYLTNEFIPVELLRATEQRLAVAEADASRYRFLRRKARADMLSITGMCNYYFSSGWPQLRGHTLDEAVDAAMATWHTEQAKEVGDVS